MPFCWDQGSPSNYRRCVYGVVTRDSKSLVVMFRVVAIALVALATFDLYFLDGSHIHAVKAMALSLLQHFIK